MTTKDLNLSLNRGLIQPKAGRNRKQKGPNVKVQPSAPRQKKRIAKLAPGSSGSRQWVAITGIAVANMLFLVLAGIWLSGHSYDSSARISSARVELTPELALTLTEINRRLDTIELQLGGLQLTIDGQHQPIVSDQFDIDGQLREALTGYEETTNSIPATHETGSSKNWHVNLGDFASRRESLDLQQQIQAIGHQAQIRPRASDNKTTFAVMLPGFSDRESAELTAKQIMEKTNLNSLWVGEGG